MSVPFTCSNGEFVFTLNGEVFYVDNEHPAYQEIVESLEHISEDDLADLLLETTPVPVKQVVGVAEVDGVVVDKDGNITLDGEPVHGAIAQKIRELSAEGLPYDNLMKFLAKTNENPSRESTLELFDFLENQGLPITEDGCFLAYKAVRSDYKDKYSGTIDNSPGARVWMKRNQVDDRRSRHCSKGLHCGALDYIAWYGGRDDKIVVVKVDPANVVSIPDDCHCQKCRVCDYTVLCDFEGEYNKPLVDEQGSYDENEELEDYVPNLDWADNNHRASKEDEDDSFDRGDVVSSYDNDENDVCDCGSGDHPNDCECYEDREDDWSDF